jgi:septal ring factor EnvC (AmiA/AmiB activator)
MELAKNTIETNKMLTELMPNTTAKYGTQYEFFKLTGVPKSTIKRAVDDGKLQLHQQPDGRNLILFAQAYSLFSTHINRRTQVFDKSPERTELEQSDSIKSVSAPTQELMELSVKLSANEAELKQLHERLKDKEKQLDDVKGDRDHWREEHKRMTLLLSSAAQQEASNPQGDQPRPNWLQRLFKP